MAKQLQETTPYLQPFNLEAHEQQSLQNLMAFMNARTADERYRLNVENEGLVRQIEEEAAR